MIYRSWAHKLAVVFLAKDFVNQFTYLTFGPAEMPFPFWGNGVVFPDLAVEDAVAVL